MRTEKIFIVGSTRTGKTLLSQILSKSERICIAEETQFLRRLSRVGREKRIKSMGDMSDDRNVDKLVAHMYSDIHTPYWIWLKRNVDRQVFKQRLIKSDRSDRAIFSVLMQTYAEETTGCAQNDLILGEETPTHIYYVPTLLEWFPQAKIIHTFRDPRAIITAQIEQVESGVDGLKVKFPSLPGWLLDPFVIPVEVLHMTKVWFDAVHLHTRYERSYPQRYHLIRFEDMINEPEMQMKLICDFLDTPFEGRMLEDTVIVTPGFKKSVDRWKEHTNPLIRAWFSILCRKHLRRFGYI